MKKAVRSISLALITSLMAVFLTSCSKTPSDADAFRALAEKKGYNVYDVTAQYINAPQIKKAIVVAPKDKSFQIEFYIITDRNSAKELFQAQSEVMDGAVGKSWSGDVSNGNNYAKRTVNTDEQFMVLSYIENTMLYVPLTDKEYKKSVETFISEFKY